MGMGSSYGVLSSLVAESSYLNGDFILNSVNYLSGSNSSATIRAKQISPERMAMTEKEVLVSIVILQYILPALIIIVGLVIWIRRRFK